MSIYSILKNMKLFFKILTQINKKWFKVDWNIFIFLLWLGLIKIDLEGWFALSIYGGRSNPDGLFTAKICLKKEHFICL